MQNTSENIDKSHIFIIGGKNIGQYGGYEKFLDRLTEVHASDTSIQYYIATKANGYGLMDESLLRDVTKVDEDTFIYHNARITKIHVAEVGFAQAVIYDIKALKWCLSYIEENNIPSPIIYVLACRIGPFFHKLVKKAHSLGAKVFVNPDGHEWKRAKWPLPIRLYWKFSERYMVKNADLMICDSTNIEEYIRSEYKVFDPKTTYISYGADIEPSELGDEDPKFTNWMESKGLTPHEYYMCCGRFVPENSFEIMIREFMKSNSKRDFAIITTGDDKFYNKLNSKLNFEADKRIKFVDTVYDADLLKKIRENAYGNFHGHTVGGTNPSLLEALQSTDLNLLIDVPFNKEVAKDAALYWNREEGNLAGLIDKADNMSSDEIETLGMKAKKRILEAYDWKNVGSRYKELWKSRQI